jgi:polar amino acid transport system substrate-binding protein
MQRAGDRRKAEQGVDMKRLSIGILTLMLAIPALPVGDRTAHAADSILTNVLHRGTVRIAITTGTPPTRFEDENGTLQGYDIDIANLLAKQLGVTIDYIKTDTAGRVAMLQTKKADITIASFTPNIYGSDQPG